METVLTIAGSDCSGGAGIQADIKTIAAHGLYATSVITALTAQNTTGVYGVEEVSPDFVAKQLDCVFMDIPPDSVKIGMVSGEKTIQAIAAKLRQYGAKHVVMDPVMVSTSGTRLLSEAGREALLEELLPLVALMTPNLPEAQVLSGLPVETRKGTCSGLPGRSPGSAGGQFSSRADICLGTPQIFCTRRGRRCGSGPGGFPIPTPTEPAAPCLPPLPAAWRRVTSWRRASGVPKRTSPAPYPLDWTWAGGRGRWTILTACG